MSDEPTGEVIRLLTKEERKAVESARTMTPLTLLMVVDTVKAEARREGAIEALEDAVDRWQFKDWSNVLLPKPAPPAIPVIAYSNSVLDWLRDRVAAARGDA